MTDKSQEGNSTLEIGENELDATKVSVMSGIIVMTIAGNFCIMACILRKGSSMVAKRTYFYMLHLSIADIITAFLTLLPELIWTLTAPNFYGGNFVCKSVKFFQMVGPYLSSYVLVMMTVDRYLAICFPLTNPGWTNAESRHMIIIAWTITIILCLPQAFIFRVSTDDPLNCRAVFQPGWGVKAYVTWFSFSNFFIPLLVLIFCYVQICKAIWRSISLKASVTVCNMTVLRQPVEDIENQSLMETNIDGDPKDMIRPKVSLSLEVSKSTTRTKVHAPEEPENGMTRAKIRSVKQTVAIIATYVACSSPFIFAQLWVAWGNPGDAVSNSVIWLFWLLTLNSVMNPWIYLVFNRELQLLLFRCGNNKSEQPEFVNQRSMVHTNNV